MRCFKTICKRKPLTKDDVSELTHRYGDSWRKQLHVQNIYHEDGSLMALPMSKSIVHLPQLICSDDTVLMIKKKLACYTSAMQNPHAITCWIQQKASKTRSISIINNIFGNRKFLAQVDFFSKLRYVTSFHTSVSETDQTPITISEAHRMIETNEIKLHTVNEVFGYKYIYDGKEVPIHVNPLRISNNDLNSLEKVSIIANLHSDESRILENYLDTPYDIYFTDVNAVKEHVLTLNTTEDLQKEIYRLYFPNWDKVKSIEQDVDVIDSIDNIIQEYESRNMLDAIQSIDTVVSNIVIQSNHTPFESMLDLDDLFTQIELDPDFPFCKVHGSLGSMNKINKSALNQGNRISKDIIEVWVRDETLRTKETNFIAFKTFVATVKEQHIYATLLLFGDTSYEIRISADVTQNLTLDNVRHSLGTVNKLLQSIKRVTEVDFTEITNDILEQTSVANNAASVARMNIMAVLQNNSKIPNKEMITDFAKNLYPFIALPKSQNAIDSLIVLGYKRINDFVNLDIIQIFILSNNNLPKEQVIQLLIDQFNIDQRKAWKIYEETISELEILKRKFHNLKHAFNKVVSIRLKVTDNMGYKMIISGLSNLKQYYRICLLVNFITNSISNKDTFEFIGKIKENKEKDDIQDSEHTITDKSRQSRSPSSKTSNSSSVSKNSLSGKSNVSSVIDDDYFADVNPDDLKFLNESDDTTLIELKTNGKNNSQVKINVKEPKAKFKGNEPSDNNEENEEKRYVIGLLNKADPNLFDYQTTTTGQHKKKYTSVCQHVDRRQPIPITADEKKRFDSQSSNAYGTYGDAINYGSTKELNKNNYYICPAVWCPKSRTPLSWEQYEKLGEKCPFPDIQEKPIVFVKTKYFTEVVQGEIKRKTRYIGFAESKHHPKGFCLPCCFIKPGFRTNECVKQTKQRYNVKDEKNGRVSVTNRDKEDDMIGNIKYIKSDIIPVDANRLGLLPKSLMNVFDVKTTDCGSRPDGTGLTHENTNCYLRKGIQMDQQPFIRCMITVLQNPGINDVQDFIDAIIKNITPELFVSLNNGDVCKYFMNRTLQVYDQDKFAFIKLKQFLSKYKSYVEKFSLEHIAHEVKFTPDFTRDIKFHDEIKREIYISNAFENFIEYIKDQTIIKSHKLLLDLCNRPLPWLNLNRINLLSINVDLEGNSLLECPSDPHTYQGIRKDKPVTIIVNQGKYYEPIVHAKLENGNLNLIMYHPYNTMVVKQLVKLVQSSIKKHDLYGLKLIEYLKSQNLKIRHTVFNFDFKVKGFVLDDNSLFIPLPDAEFMFSDLIPGTIIYVTEIKNLKPNIDVKFVDKLFRRFNRFFEKDVFQYNSIASSSKDKNRIIIMENGDVIPLQTQDLKANNFDSYEIDASVFISKEIEDDRIKLISEYESKSNLYITLKNEILKVLKEMPALLGDLYALRNISSPFPRHVARKILHDKILPQISHSIYIKKSMPLPTKYENIICSTIKDPVKCRNPCSMLVEVKDGKVIQQYCGLSLTEELFNSLLLKAIDELLSTSSLYRLRFSQFTTDDNKKQKDIIIGSEDLANGKLNEYLRVADSYQALYTQTEIVSIQKKDLLKSDVPDKKKNTIIFTEGYKTLPTRWASKLSGFKNVYFSQVPDIHSLHKLFLYINNKINKNKRLTKTQIQQLHYKYIWSKLNTNDSDFVALMLSNPCVAKQYKKTQNVDANALKTFVNAKFLTEDYTPSDADIDILASITNLNVLLLSRIPYGANKQDGIGDLPDGMRCFGKYPKREYFICLNKEYIRSKNADLFSLVVHPIGLPKKPDFEKLDPNEFQNDFLFTADSFPTDMKQLVCNKCRLF